MSTRAGLAFVLMMCLCACHDGGGSNSSTSSQPVLSLVPQGSGVRYTRDAVESSSFELGNLPVTTSYLFLLDTAGSAPLTKLRLASSSSSVIGSPAAIASVPPAGSGGVTPIIQVQILHGVGPSGYGAAPTLPAGDFPFTITATGTNADGLVTMTAAMTVFVQVANYTISVEGEDLSALSEEPVLVELSDASIYNMTMFFGDISGDQAQALTQLTPAPAPANSLSNLWPGQIQLTNTGNVPLQVAPYLFDISASSETIWYASSQDPTTLAPGNTVQLTCIGICATNGSGYVLPGAFVVGDGYIVGQLVVDVSSGDTVFGPGYVPAQVDGSSVLEINLGLMEAPAG